MTQEIEDLYLKLMQRAKERMKLIVSVPSKPAKSWWKSAPSKNQPAPKETELKTQYQPQELTLAHKELLSKNMADLKQIIPILKRDRSTHLSPILEEIQRVCSQIGGTHLAESKTISFNAKELLDFSSSDLKQNQGFRVGIQALQTLALIYQSSLRPEPKSALEELAVKYNIAKDALVEQRKAALAFKYYRV